MNRPRKSPTISPVLLLPAFVLGLIVATTFYQFKLASLRQLALSPITPFKFPASIELSPETSQPSAPPQGPYSFRDHVYLPSDFLNQTWSLKPSSGSTGSGDVQSAYPLIELIENATIRWNSKLSSQSKNLDSAVKEYQRRYNRPPPRGFDKWFDWAKKNDIVLIDEYDRIDELIQPFWALPPNVLRDRSEKLGQKDTASRFFIKDGQIETAGAKKDDPRTKDQLKLLGGFSKFLPDVNLTMSHHDGPSSFMDWKTKSKHLNFARSGQTLPPEEYDKVEDDASLWGFVGACSPDSPMRMYSNGLGSDLNSPAKGLRGGYIGLDHAKTMDLCNHPEWKEFHGFTSWAGPRPGILNPIFSFSQSSSFASDILNVPLEQFDDSNKNQHDFKSFKDKSEKRKILWKGQTTGIWFDRITSWRTSHRMRLHRLGQAHRHHYGHELYRDVRVPKLVQTKPARSALGELDRAYHIKVEERRVNLKDLSEKFLDASFVGELVQCTVEDGSCDAIKHEIQFQPYVDWTFQNNFRYVLDVDGNSWSGRFRRLLSSNSLVFKSTIWPEWYRDQIQPWYHYIPVRVDYEDLFDLIQFFTADEDGSENETDEVENGGDGERDRENKTKPRIFEALALQIANQGTDWVKHHFRYEDLQAYMWRTCLEWARVSSDDRLKMNFSI